MKLKNKTLAKMAKDVYEVVKSVTIFQVILTEYAATRNLRRPWSTTDQLRHCWKSLKEDIAKFEEKYPFIITDQESDSG